MSLTRFAPQIGQAFHLPAQNPAVLFRMMTPWFFVALAALFVKDMAMPGAAAMGLVLNGIAFGGFGFFWQRFAAGPHTVPLAGVGTLARLLAWGFAYQVLLAFEGFPAPFLALLIGDGPNAPVLILVGLQIFQVLVGAMFLILPRIALAPRHDSGATLQELVLAGGLAVGLGYVVAGLPFVVATQILLEGFAALTPSGTNALISSLIQLVLAFIAMAVIGGYFALVWGRLKATTVSRLQPETPENDGPAKARRTTRLTRNKR